MSERIVPQGRNPRPVIGVFDSGFGGLTVLRALAERLPSADYLYLGDSARLPYGSKSAATVTHYTAAALRYLRAHGAELGVVACNTASALALPGLVASAPMPLVGVVEPGARAAAAAVPSGATILVLATEATVASGAYADACTAYGINALQKACPLLVPLVEEGWTDDPITEQIARIYLSEALGDRTSQISADLLARDGMETRPQPAAILLGCTHYPLLRPLLHRVVTSLTDDMPIVDAAGSTAAHVATLFPTAAAIDGAATFRFFTTDSPEKFRRLGARFLGQPVDSVSTVDLDAF